MNPILGNAAFLQSLAEALEQSTKHVLSDSPAKHSTGRRTRRMRTLPAVFVLVLVFIAIYVLFLPHLAPGVPDFYPPSNMTGTTTITTSYGYVCTASGNASHSEITCSPEFFGSLHVPIAVSLLSLGGFAALCVSVYSLFLRRPRPATAEAQ